MPIYEYRCDDCGRGFEAFVRPGHRDAECPECSGTALSRQMSVFSARGGNGDAAEAARSRMAASNAPRGGGGCCGGSCGCGH